ncbi:thiol peroxidase [Dysgonomonas sp. 521]|uniref:thiol peroxidase n=1 Tax=Dysgonomonas sp. 521 TaxID=2302932 RepID=UPI0013D607D3|nr:thiol peroxidase [Dysgonomonas sp. 521]NDV96254.1 thiol peroxidase [Dysgonomonas sp. 521]
MAKVTFKGSPVNTSGQLPAVGSPAPDFTLVKTDLSDVTLKDLNGKNVILNIFPSLDTAVCAASVRKFNKEAASLPNTVILAISADLPFAAGRFCTTEGIENVHPASTFRNPEFAKDYGVLTLDGPLKGLLARSVVVLDGNGKVLYNELVEETTNEPNYQAAISVLK